mgnify:CR=1 FL=1
MNVTIGPRPDPAEALERLRDTLAGVPVRVIACSGGIDSLLLALVAHRMSSDDTLVAHTLTPAVPSDGTERVEEYADREGWRLEIVRSREFDDERYLSNPTDRCYHCKRNLYDAVGELRSRVGDDAVILSGANVDDLGEYRPGLVAAAERSVRHPYVEAGITKSEIRAIARHLGVVHADLPASPCLASRLYTGTRVTPSRLRAVEAGEAVVRRHSGIDVVRCRIDGDHVRVEVTEADRPRIDRSILAAVAQTMQTIEPGIVDVVLDGEPYRPGRAVAVEA